MNFKIKEKTEESALQRIYFPELDGLRFFAFLLVFIHHHNLFSKTPYLETIKANLWIGVDLFFSLSAFLFTKLLVTEFNTNHTISFKKFYFRRILRIWPLYFIFVGFLFIDVSKMLHGSIPNYLLYRFLGLITFSDNIMSVFNGYNPARYGAHLWTISFEEQFYVVMPFIILLFSKLSLKKRILILTTIIILLNILRLLFIHYNAPFETFYVLPITHFESILFGIAIGFGGSSFLLTKIKPLIIGIIGLIFFMMLCMLPDIKNVTYWLFISYLFAGIATSMTLIAVLKSSSLKAVFSNKTAVFLGKRSYGLYIFHIFGNGFSIYLVSYFPSWLSNNLTSFIVSLISTIILAVISYYIIETPFLKWKKKFELIASRPI